VSWFYTTQQWAFFGLHARAWELGLGALLALAWNNINNIAAWLRAIVGWLGLVAVIASCFLFNEKVLFPGYAVLLPVVGTLCVLIAGDDNRYGPQVLLRFEALQFIGARSYSLYLWHWPALIIGEAAYGHTLNATERILLLGIAFCGACLSYAYVENPVRHSTKLQLPGAALNQASTQAHVRAHYGRWPHCSESCRRHRFEIKFIITC